MQSYTRPPTPYYTSAPGTPVNTAQFEQGFRNQNDVQEYQMHHMPGLEASHAFGSNVVPVFNSHNEWPTHARNQYTSANLWHNPIQPHSARFTGPLDTVGAS